MPKILLLGASGFIGSNIARELDRRGHEWIGVSRNRRHHQGGSRIVTLDDEQEILSVCNNRPTVINALGALKPQDFVRNFNGAMDEFWVAIQRTLYLLRRNPPGVMLQISSAGTIYGEAPQDRPSEESDPPEPQSWYGRMKLVEESLFQQCAHQFDTTYLCARVTNPFGNEDHPTHGLIDVLIDHVRRDEPFKACFRKGACRDFIFAPEMAKTLVTMAEYAKPGIFNVGRGESVSLSQLILTVREKAPWANIESTPANDADVAVSAVAIHKLMDTFGLHPEGPSAIEYLRNKLSSVNI